MSSADGHKGGSGDPLLGQVFLDRYRVARRLDGHGRGTLYDAEPLSGERHVIIEVLAAEHAHPAAVDQFLEQARILARIGHENVVQIINGGRSPQGAVFLASEPAEGTDLAQLLAKDGPLPWDRAQGIVMQLAAALGAAHRHGIVHSDLGPENVLVEPRAGRRDFVKVRGFGVARLEAEPPGAEPQPGALDHRVDVRALGALAYHMVTGQPPLAAKEAEAPPETPATEAPRAPSALRPPGTLPVDLDAVILRALDKDPDKRWPDMATFSEAISKCRLTRRQSVRVEALAIAELSGHPEAFEADARRQRRFWSVASVVAGVAIAIGVLHVLARAPGHVQISTTPVDAELTFNGMPVAARSPVVLDAAPGRYTLIVSRAGYVTAERIVDVSARATVAVPVQLVAVPAPATPPPAEAAAAAVAPAPGL
ncbi:MAG TPA: serine/threonine-protein kinase [Polyangia bacterium]|jgi:serine/threonine-protein kinase